MAMTDFDPRIPHGFRQLDEEIMERTGTDKTRAFIAQRDLQRYYIMLQISLLQFDIASACVLVEALKDCVDRQTEIDLLGMIWFEKERTILGLAEKWQVDSDTLLNRLHELDFIQSLAIIDAAERYWNNLALSGTTIEDGVEKLGLGIPI